ncbi:MAG: hypothetical protein M1309_00125 [Actinobacteria bacterium]|nr:hypothetical protein [Actinomycetota bacterium]
MELVILIIVGLVIGIIGAMLMEVGVSPRKLPSERLGFFSEITIGLAGALVTGYLFSTAGVTGSYGGWILTALLGSVVPLVIIAALARAGRA